MPSSSSRSTTVDTIDKLREELEKLRSLNLDNRIKNGEKTLIELTQTFNQLQEENTRLLKTTEILNDNLASLKIDCDAQRMTNQIRVLRAKQTALKGIEAKIAKMRQNIIALQKRNGVLENEIIQKKQEILSFGTRINIDCPELKERYKEILENLKKGGIITDSDIQQEYKTLLLDVVKGKKK